MSSRELYFRLLGHVKPYRRQFAAAIVAMVILALTEPAIPALLKPLLDGTFVEKDPVFMYWAPIGLLMLFLVRGLTNFVSSVAFAWVSGKVVYDLRVRLFERILGLATPYFDQNSTGNTVSKITYNVSQVTEAATKVLTVMVKDGVAIVGLIAYLLWLNWLLALMVFVLLPVVALVVTLIAKRLRKLSRQLQNMMGNLTHALEEGTRGHREIKVFGGQSIAKERFNSQANWIRRYQMKIKVASAANGPVVEFVGAAMLAVLIYVGTHQTGEGALSVGGFVAFLTGLGLLFPPIKRITSINEPLQRGLAAAESVFDLIDEPPELDLGTKEIGRATGRLEFREVVFQYPKAESKALHGVSFTIEPGKTVALVGPSGGGKTTIASVIPRFYNLAGGQILLDGVDIKDLTLTGLRTNLSMVGQDPLLFNDTIGANIAFGREEGADAEQLREIAKAAHALDFIEKLPDGFESLVGEDGVLLSGGQRQRVAIARALLKDAPVLILDEATSALDTESERHVQAALHSLTENRTTLVIAHRLSTIEHADLILVVKEGQVVERGTHAELLAMEGEYTKLYRNQFLSQAEKALPDTA